MCSSDPTVRWPEDSTRLDINDEQETDGGESSHTKLQTRVQRARIHQVCKGFMAKNTKPPGAAPAVRFAS